MSGVKGVWPEGWNLLGVGQTAQHFPKRTRSLPYQQQRAVLAFVILGDTKQFCARLSELKKPPVIRVVSETSTLNRSFAPQEVVGNWPMRYHSKAPLERLATEGGKTQAKGR